MYDKVTIPENVRHVCKDLQLPWNFCQLLSQDRTVCLVNDEWIKSLHLGSIIPVLATDDLDTCQVERFLSRSCEKIPHPWMKVSVKTIAKSDSLYHELPGQHLQKLWSCGCLFEFMSHISKENIANLWAQARMLWGHTHQHSGGRSEACLFFTDVVKELLRRLQPLAYISLLAQKDPSSDKLQQSLPSSASKLTSNSTADSNSFSTGNSTADSSSFSTGTSNSTADSSSFSTGTSNRAGNYTTSDTQSCHGIVPVDVVIESQSYLYIVQPYYPFTLQDVVTLSPAILETSHAKPLFIIYQLLCAMHALHNHGLRMGDIRLSDIVMNKNMWLRIASPRLHSLKVCTAPAPVSKSDSCLPSAASPGHGSVPALPDVLVFLSQQPHGSLANSERFYEAACNFMKAEQFKYYKISMLDEIVNAWAHRRVTNFQYLMILNHLAGRQMGDPNNHPVLPWVLDFSAPDSGYRDLTKSKFRLNKGDGQLDFMYSGMHEVSDSGDHVPHHVSDILSDITYYVYKARRTPKHILCAHVRSNWVPHEYPVSMQRLQDWTPDECIPEFFTDPAIFDSIHEDLPDLEIPAWSKNTVDFVMRHLAALESDYVSTNLHHWIDLTFGYKLNGVAAVKSKNVHLHLADQHTHLTTRGAAQLFQQPHPQRKPPQTSTSSLLPRITRGLLNTQLLTYGMPESESDSQYADASFDSSELGRVNQAAIHLPRNYHPLAELEQCETLEEFKARALHVIAPNPCNAQPPPHPQYQDDGITEDMVTLTCLTCEMFMDARLRMQDSQPPLWKRVSIMRQLCLPDLSAIHRPLQQFVRDMFENLQVTEDKRMYFEAIFSDGSPPPTPGFLIQPYSELIPFPAYFGELYTCLSKIEEKTWHIELLKRKRMSVQERASKIKQLEREKVPVLGTFLWKYQSYLGAEGMGIVLPYIQDLLQNEYTTVQSAWSLFDSITRELGPSDSAKQFLSFLTSLFSGEVSSAKHIKLYHRSFLTQLIVRLGLETFLTYFSTLLVEAVAGYKDFHINSRFHAEELLEELDQQTKLQPALGKSTSMVWSAAEFSTSQDYSHDVVDTDVDGHRNSDEKNENDDLVDQMSLDGEHVPLDDDGLDSDRKISQGDTSERDSLGSESSDDRIEETVMKRRAIFLDDEDGVSGGAYDNLDQHSIHSISHIMSKNLTDSPSALDDLEPFEAAFHDGETSAPTEGSPLFCGRATESVYSERHSQSSQPSEPVTAGGDNNEEVLPLTSLETTDCQHPAVSIEGSVTEDKDEQTHRCSQHDELTFSPQTAANCALVAVQLSHLESVLESSSEDNYKDGHVKDSQQNVYDTVDGKQEKEMLDTSSYDDDDEVDAKIVTSSSCEYQLASQKTGSDMVRSETEDIMVGLSSDSSGHITNIRDVAADSVKWLSHKLGPVLATKFLSRNLVRMLALCYLGQEQLQPVEDTGGNCVKTSRLVVGDKNSQKVLECLQFTVVLYGEQVVLIQCLTSILDMVKMAQKRLSPRCEGGLIASVVLLSFLIPYLSDTNLMNLLEESIIYKCINPVLCVVTSGSVCFPSGTLARSVLCHKLIDLLYILGLRLGLEMSRKYLTSCMQQLFDTFSIVHGTAGPSLDSAPMEPSLEHASCGSDESYLTINMDPLTKQYKIGSPINLRSLKASPKRSLSKIHSLSSVAIIDDKDDYMDPRSPSSTVEKCAQELKSVFSPELAQACYIPLCRIFGSIHMEEHLPNEDLIRRLCSQHDSDTDSTTPGPACTVSSAHNVDDLLTPTEERAVAGGIGSNITLVGNRIHIHEVAQSPVSPSTQPELEQFGRGYRHSGILGIHVDDLRSSDMEQNKSRHLRGHWLAYWERELGLHERDTMFNFMQIDLQTYLGHNSSIRCLYTMDTENCFISACKDKTVRLWSINSSGDGMNKQHCQHCYSRHKKSVFSVAYVESMRLVASCDSTVHVWDPFTGVSISQLESPKYAPVVALTALPAPSTLVAMATTEASLRFLDMRTCKYTHEFRCSVGSAGLIRCVVVSPDSNWVAIGFSTGLIYILDVNSGMFLHYWRAHDAEILQLKAYSRSRLLSSAFDQSIKLWNVDTGQEVCPSKSQAEAVHCLSIYRDQLLTATTANRISVYASVTDSTAFASSKLKSFKGVVTCMSVLPLHKALLLGADNGTIRLMA